MPDYNCSACWLSLHFLAIRSSGRAVESGYALQLKAVESVPADANVLLTVIETRTTTATQIYKNQNKEIHLNLQQTSTGSAIFLAVNKQVRGQQDTSQTF